MKSETNRQKLADKIKSNEEVEKFEVPEGGHRIYIDDDYHWVVRKMDPVTYKQLKKYIRIGKDSEGAIWALQRLMEIGTVDPADAENDLDYLIAVENAIADLIKPMTAQIKKK